MHQWTDDNGNCGMIFGLGRWMDYTNRFFDENVVFCYNGKHLKAGACMSVEGDESGKVYIYLEEVDGE